MEQGLVKLTKDKITLQMILLTFTKIILSLDQLSDTEKAVLVLLQLGLISHSLSYKQLAKPVEL